MRRLRTEQIDLYLLHWRGSVPLAETLDALLALQDTGWIRYYGVSNFDVDDMEELWGLRGGPAVQTDQVLYNLAHRGIEVSLMPWLRRERIPPMAYSPIGHGELIGNSRLAAFAERIGMTAAQVALAWVLQHDDVIAIPKASRRERLRENIAALDQKLTREQLAQLDQMFPRPSRPIPLEMI
jgi:diketogulonate reductase-like aldo/keto reductase